MKLGTSNIPQGKELHHMATANTAPEKPEMAGKKVWKFDIAKGKEADIPVTVRTGGPGLPLPFDGMEPGDHFHVPVAFWLDRGIAKDKATAPLNKDRIRRAFYNWQAKDKTRAKFVLAFSDHFDKKDPTKYVGAEVYLAKKAN